MWSLYTTIAVNALWDMGNEDKKDFALSLVQETKKTVYVKLRELWLIPDDEMTLDELI